MTASANIRSPPAPVPCRCRDGAILGRVFPSHRLCPSRDRTAFARGNPVRSCIAPGSRLARVEQAEVNACQGLPHRGDLRRARHRGL
jgi:hypothetical protein